MRRLGTKLGLQLVLLLIAFGAASTLHAQLINSYATLDVCNKGTVKVYVATAIEEDNFPSFTPLWNVAYWTRILPGACERVYYDRSETGNQVAGWRAYIGFGLFFDAQGHFVTGTVDRMPDFGEVGLPWSKILTKTNKRFCINDSDNGMTYRIEDPLERNCATFHPSGNGDKTKPFYPFAAALYFRPETSYCPVYPATGDCTGGQYHLNVAPGPNDVDGNLHVSAGSSSDSSSSSSSSTSSSGLTDALKTLGDALNKYNQPPKPFDDGTLNAALFGKEIVRRASGNTNWYYEDGSRVNPVYALDGQSQSYLLDAPIQHSNGAAGAQQELQHALSSWSNNRTTEISPTGRLFYVVMIRSVLYKDWVNIATLDFTRAKPIQLDDAIGFDIPCKLDQACTIAQVRDAAGTISDHIYNNIEILVVGDDSAGALWRALWNLRGLYPAEPKVVTHRPAEPNSPPAATP